MIQIINWLKKHPIATMAIICITFFLPLVVVHCLFKWNTECVWLSATWSSGDVLGYIAGFEAFLGAVVLGAITVYQTEIANRINIRLSKENNYLQKISIQKMLPLLRVTALVVDNAKSCSVTYSTARGSTLEVVDVGTPKNRNTLIRTYLPRVGSANGYRKTIKLTLENISDGVISQISVDRIEFSGFNYKGNHTDMVSCVGSREAKHVSWDEQKNMWNIHQIVSGCSALYKDGWAYKNYSRRTDNAHFETSNPLDCKSYIGTDYRDWFDRTRITELFAHIKDDQALEFRYQNEGTAFSMMIYPQSLSVTNDVYIEQVYQQLNQEIEGFSDICSKKATYINRIEKLKKKIAKKAREPFSFWSTFFGAFTDLFR